MEKQPENKPPRKRPRAIAFLIAGIGLFLLDAAADSLMLHNTNTLGLILVAAGIALIALAVLWDTLRI